MRPRLLLITYSFPPDTQVGALRWQKFARHASDFGWGMDVVTLDSKQFARTDEAGLRDLPADTRRIEVSQGDPLIWRIHRSALALRRRGARSGTSLGADGPKRGDKSAIRTASRSELRNAYLAILEYAYYRRWAHDAFRAARRLIDTSVHRAIVTTGPPHMAHEAGRLASQSSGLPLVADFRDLWSGVEHLDDIGRVWYWIARMYQRRVMARAEIIVANTSLAADRIRAAYPEQASRVITVMNGYDDDSAIPDADRGSQFRLAFAGSIYLDRSPQMLFKAASRVIQELQLSPSDFSIEFMGDVSSVRGLPMEEMARDAGVADYVRVHPPQDRKAAHRFLASAAMLLNLPQENRSAVPAKVFEYMRFPAWILALNDAGSATGALLETTGADLVPPNDIDAIARVLRHRIQQFRAGVLPQPIAHDGRFSRRRQALVLFRAIEALTKATMAASAETTPSDSVRDDAVARSN